MGLEDFFDDKPPDSKQKNNKIPSKKIEKEKKEIQESIVENILPFKAKEFEVGMDIQDLFLLDVKYIADPSLAQCIFYHLPSKSIYKWNDNTNHKPYLLTFLSESSIKQISKVYKSSEFAGIEEISKYYPLMEREEKITKVYGTNPLAIGGRSTSFREYIDPAFEADIRYHFNYVADKKLTPGTFYEVIDGNLVPSRVKIDSEIEKQLLEEFKDENSQQIDMLHDYMPLLFQEIPDILRVAFDIEVGSHKGVMPNPNKAAEQIISIATVDSENRKICWVLNTETVDQEVEFKDLELRRFNQEREMLEDFYFTIDQYPIIISFNGDNFDCPYLFSRSLLLGIDSKHIPMKQKRADVAFENSVHIDLYRFFRQAAIRIYAFGGKYDSSSLDELSKALLDEKKLEHPEVWMNEMDLATLVKYNVKDAELTLKLTQFDNNVVLNLMFILMRICKMPLYDFSRLAVSSWLQMWLIYEHRKRNFLIPRKQDILNMKGETAASSATIDGKKFQGAIVLDPKPGVWWNVRVLDFASLYPSIIKTKNLSYETIRCSHEECKSNRVPEVNHWICTRRLGIFSIVLGFVRDTRVKWFKPRSSDSKLDEKERRINQIIQSSLKVLINAGYGVIGSEQFDFYCPPVAESTTAFARDAITKTQLFVENELGITVLYGDTDSVFLYQITDEQTEELLKWGEKEIGVELGTDYIFRYVVFSDRKKNYFGVTTEGKIIVKGLMGKKRNTPKIIRDNFDKSLQILKKVHSDLELNKAKDEIKRLLQSMISKLEKGEFKVEDASITLTISRKLKDYETWTQTLQAISQLYDKGIIKPGDLDVGDRISFIKLNSPIQVNIQDRFKLAFPSGVRMSSVIPVQLITDDFIHDGKPLIDSAESTFSQFLQSIGLSWDNVMGIQSLDDWF